MVISPGTMVVLATSARFLFGGLAIGKAKLNAERILTGQFRDLVEDRANRTHLADGDRELVTGHKKGTHNHAIVPFLVGIEIKAGGGHIFFSNAESG